jgi:hypothetical protein
MNDVDTRLTALFDEIASSIDPTPDFEAVMNGTGGLTPVAGTANAGRGGRPFRRVIAVAAAVALVAGGAAAAFQLDGEPEMVASDELVVPTTIESEVTVPTTTGGDAESETTSDDTGEVEDPVNIRTAALGAGRLDTDPIRQIVLGRSMPGELVRVSTPYGETETTTDDDGRWRVVLEIAGVPPTTLVPIEVSFEDETTIELTIVTPAAEPEPTPDTTVAAEEPEPKAEEPKAEEPKTEQPKTEQPKTEQPVAAVPFTASLGASYADASPMKQVVFGTATPGTKVLVTSAYGNTTVEAGSKGGWEAHLKMHDVPGGTDVRITVTASGFGQEYEFWVRRPMPEAKPFTAAIAATHLEGDPVKVVFQGTGAPGSKVTASADYGSADTVVSGSGHWELKLMMSGVPAQTNVGIRVADAASGTTKDFSVTTSAAPAPKHHFKAHAAYEDCDETPPYNEYWGTAAPGSTVTISSPYGGAQVSVGESGAWSARVEFPSAPVGEKFQVSLTNSQDGHSFTFGFMRIAPA